MVSSRVLTPAIEAPCHSELFSNTRLRVPKGSMYPIIGYLRDLLIGIVVQVLGKYLIIGYLDP